MAGIVIEFPAIDQFNDLDNKLNNVNNSFNKATHSLNRLAKGGMGKGVSALSDSSMDVGMMLRTVPKIVTAIAAVGFGMHKLAQASNASIITQYSSGASDGQVGWLNTAGRASGSTGAGMAGMANSLAEKLREGGIASSWARSQGVLDFGPRTLNKVDNLEKAIEKLRKVEDQSYRMFLTRELGLSEASPLIEMSDRGYNLVKTASKNNALTREQKQSLAEMEAGIAGMWDGAITNMQRGVAGFYDFMFPKDISKSGLTRTPQDGKSRPASSQEQAIRENTDAIRDATRAARNERIHMGRRTMAAVPKAWTAQAAEMAQRDQARRLGGI